MALTAGQVVSLAMGAGFTRSQANTMATIAKFESEWNPNNLNDNPSTGDLSYGLWQINMIGDLGPERRKSFGISSNTELFDPVTNARAAHKVYQWQGYNAWSVYKHRNSYSNWNRVYLEVSGSTPGSTAVGITTPTVGDAPASNNDGGSLLDKLNPFDDIFGWFKSQGLRILFFLLGVTMLGISAMEFGLGKMPGSA